MIKTYETLAAYEAAGIPITESRVAFIEESKEIKIDGVNIQVTHPVCGDAVYHDGEKVVYFKGGDLLNHSLLSSKYTKVGEVIGYIGNKKLIIHHASQGSLKWCDCVLWAITAISSPTIKLNMRMAGNYEVALPVEIILESTELNEANALIISNTLNEAGNADNIGYDKHKWWAFYDEGNNRIIVQNDQSGSYRQYSENMGGSGTNVTISLCVYDDMPVSSSLFRKNNTTTYYGGMSFSKFKTYYSTSGVTPKSNVTLTTIDIVNLNSFNTSEYCTLLRETYNTYDEYLEDRMVKFPLKHGVFNLPEGKTLTYKYGDATFVTKTGETKWKYPAMHAAKSIRFEDIKGIDIGNWYLPGVYEGMMLMNDENRAKINATVTKFGTGSNSISNLSHRWFSQRYGSYGTWHFFGCAGFLGASYVYGSFLVLGVANLFKEILIYCI